MGPFPQVFEGHSYGFKRLIILMFFRRLEPWFLVSSGLIHGPLAASSSGTPAASRGGGEDQLSEIID